jgi:CBS domain containing-hemolysin-like protein
MDIKKEALEFAGDAAENVSQSLGKGVVFLKSSLLRTLVILSLSVTVVLIFLVWASVYNSVAASDAFETFLNTAMAVMASPLLLVAMYYYFDSLASLMKKMSKLSNVEKLKHRKNLIIAAVAAGLAGWAIKLFFLPAVFFAIVTLYMVKLIAVKQD